MDPNKMTMSKTFCSIGLGRNEAIAILRKTYVLVEQMCAQLFSMQTSNS